MKHLVGINGYQRSGKGTTANMLSDAYDGVVQQVGFADKVKIISALALGFERPPQELIALMDEFKINARIGMEYFEPNEQASRIHELTGRGLLQNVGNHARNVFGDSFWVDQVLPNLAQFDGPSWNFEAWETLEDMYPNVDCLAITDLRYPNEALRVLQLGGVIWRVNRPGTSSDGHASEQRLDDGLVTWEIDNSGTLDDLKYEVDKAISETLSC